MKISPSRIVLLPHYFQKIAVALFVVSITLSIVLKNYVPIDVDIKPILGNVLLITALIFIYSKGKVEDEMTMQLRYSAFLLAFQIGVMMCIVDPYINWLMGDGFHLGYSAFDLVGMIVFNYIGIYSIYYFSEKE